MAQARTDAIIDTWKTKANLTLSAEEEQKVRIALHRFENPSSLSLVHFLSSKPGSLVLLNASALVVKPAKK